MHRVYCEALKSAAMETVLLCSCLWFRRHNRPSPEEVAARAVLEKTQVIFDQLSGEEEKKKVLFRTLQEGALLCVIHVSIWASVK